MTEEIVLERLNGVFRQVLDQPGLQIGPETTALDVDGWDSMSHVMLVVEIEQQFKKRFKSREIAEWKSVGDMIASILRA